MRHSRQDYRLMLHLADTHKFQSLDLQVTSGRLWQGLLWSKNKSVFAGRPALEKSWNCRGRIRRQCAQQTCGSGPPWGLPKDRRLTPSGKVASRSSRMISLTTNCGRPEMRLQPASQRRSSRYGREALIIHLASTSLLQAWLDLSEGAVPSTP